MPTMLKSIGGWILGILMVVLMLGAWGLCRFGYGQARPYIPAPIRTLTGNENEFDADDYLRSVPRQIERFFEQSDRCSVERNQTCQTKAVEDPRDALGTGVPAPAIWMSGSHSRLYAAIAEAAIVNKLS